MRGERDFGIGDADREVSSRNHSETPVMNAMNPPDGNHDMDPERDDDEAADAELKHLQAEFEALRAKIEGD